MTPLFPRLESLDLYGDLSAERERLQLLRKAYPPLCIPIYDEKSSDKNGNLGLML